MDYYQTYELECEFPTTWSEKTNPHRLSQSQSHQTDEHDPLGLFPSISTALKSNGVEIDPQTERYHVYSPKFNPKVFLRDVHRNSSHQDLELALERLRHSLASQPEPKSSDHDDYDKYILTKRMLDSVLGQMRSAGITTEYEFGLGRLSSKLETVANKYTLATRPIEEAAYQKASYQNALDVIKSSKYLFGLEPLLSSLAKNNERAEFTRELRRGVAALHEFSDAQNPPGCKRIGHILQENLAKVVSDYRNQVWQQLLETPPGGNPARHFSTLAELHCEKNPVHEWMLLQTKRYNEKIAALFDTLHSSISHSVLNENIGDNRDSRLKLHLGFLTNETNPDSYRVLEFWVTVVLMFHQLHETLLEVFQFWREGSGIVQGNKGDSVLRLTGGQEAEVRSEFTKILGLLAAKTMELFKTPPPRHLALPAAAESQRLHTSLAFVPEGANSISTAKYLVEIFDSIRAMHSEACEIIGPQNPLSELVGTVSELFINTLAESWTRDSMTFGEVQDWSLDTERNTVTYLSSYHHWMMDHLRKLSPQTGGTQLQKYIKTISTSFSAAISLSLESMYSHLSQAVYEPSELEPKLLDQDSRVLLTLGNFTVIAGRVLPELYAHFESSFGASTVEMQRELRQVADSLHTNLFDLYLRKSKAGLSNLISSGIKSSSRALMHETPPLSISNYVYRSLMLLVDVHGRVSEYAPEVLGRLLSVLYQYLLTCVLTNIRELDRIASGGVLQVVANVEFVRATLHTLKQMSTTKTTQLIYERLQQVCANRELFATKDGPISRVAGIVEQARMDDRLTFACFRSVRAE